MDAVKFLAEYNRMCNTYDDCVECPMHDEPFCHPHDMTTNDERKELVDAVEKWSCEHPMVTNEMNDDTISRAMAVDEIARWIGYLDDDMIGRIQLSLKRLPSAQLEQKKGRWAPYLTEGLRYKCSECESKYETPWHFCPNCGSYNGGESDDKKRSNKHTCKL